MTSNPVIDEPTMTRGVVMGNFTQEAKGNAIEKAKDVLAHALTPAELAWIIKDCLPQPIFDAALCEAEALEPFKLPRGLYESEGKGE